MLRLRETFYTLFRDSYAGKLLYYISARRVCRPSVEHKNYVVPKKYLNIHSHNQKSSQADAVSDLANEMISVRSNKLYGESNGELEVLTTWDDINDPDNPINWPFLKKAIVTIVLSMCTTSLYMGAAIVTPATEKLMSHFETTETKTQLGVTLFVWGYGISSLWFGPMSEIPIFGGRNHLYLVCQFLFVCFQIPLGFINHIAPYAVLRLLSGIVASPPLTNVGGSLHDMWGIPSVFFAMMVWNLGAVVGPYLGPIIGAALVNHNSWRWIFWYLIIQAGSIFAVFCVLCPETSEQALLMRKASRLRRITGNSKITSRGELLQQSDRVTNVLGRIFWHPIKLTLHEPVLLLINVHLGLVYAIIYIYFEAFPLSFGNLFHFNLVQQGLAYLMLITGDLTCCIVFIPFYYHYLVKPIRNCEEPDPEVAFAVPSIFGSLLLAIGLLLFGWTSTPPYWEPPLFLNYLVAIGIWIMFQCYMSYIGALYPTKFASALASNTLIRCLLSGSFPLYASVMYKHTAIKNFPVAWGCTILGFSCIIFTILPTCLALYGKRLRLLTLRKYGDAEKPDFDLHI